jgi:hypothetical protein
MHLTLVSLLPLPSIVQLTPLPPLCSEVNSGFFYKTARDREAMVLAERQFIDDRVRKIIAFKKEVCGGEGAPGRIGS